MNKMRMMYFEKDGVLHLAISSEPEAGSVELAPPIARRLAAISWGLCLLLESLKIFNTHYLAAISNIPPERGLGCKAARPLTGN